MELSERGKKDRRGPLPRTVILGGFRTIASSGWGEVVPNEVSPARGWQISGPKGLSLEVVALGRIVPCPGRGLWLGGYLSSSNAFRTLTWEYREEISERN